MIKQIHIKNFKSVQDLKLELGRINVFIGANGSGKSNILEAIALAGAYSADKLDYEFLTSRGIRIPSDLNHFKSLFNLENITQSIKIEFQLDRELPTLKYEINLYDLADGKNWSREYQIPHIEERVKFKINEGSSEVNDLEQLRELVKEEISKMFGELRNSEIEKFIIYQPEYSPLRNLFDETQIRPLGIHGEGLFRVLNNFPKERINAIKELLKSFDWFETFNVDINSKLENSINIKDRFIDKGFEWFDQRSVNEGFLFILFYLTLFSSDKTPAFFAVDNVESTLNPLLSQQLLHSISDLAKKNNKQAILTTHSAVILDGLDLRDDDQRLFVISRDMDGQTVAKRIREYSNESDKSMKLSERWMRGYIGGLPDNF